MFADILDDYYNLHENTLIPGGNKVNGIQLPIVKFIFDIEHDWSKLSELETVGKKCPNYVVLSSDITHLTSFINNLKHSLKRKDSRYLLILTSDRRFSAQSFFEDVPFFKKVLNCFLVVMSNKMDITFARWDIESPILNRYI